MTDDSRSLVKVSPSQQSFKIIIVGIIQRDINLAVMRDAPYAVHQDESAVLAGLRGIFVGSERLHYSIGQIAATMGIRHRIAA